MVDPAEQEPQPHKPDRSRRVRNWAVGGAAVTAAVALAAPFVLHDKTVEARPAPSTTTYSPETPAPAPTTEAPTPTPTPTETVMPAATDIPEQLVEGREKLQVDATNAALSVLRDMDRPGVGMTHEGYDNLTLGNPDKTGDVSAMLATYVPKEKLIQIRSIAGNNGGEGGGSSQDGAAVDLEFQITNDNPIARETDQLTTEDFRNAINDTDHTTLLSATAQANGTWRRLSFDQHRVNASDEPNNVYVIDDVNDYRTFASELATTLQTAQDQLATIAS